MLDAGRLTITRAIYQRGDDILEVELDNFQRKKKKNIVGIRTHAHSFDRPVQLPLGHQETTVEFPLNYSFNIQLIVVLQSPSPN